jgi:hypothetical protein
MNGSARCLLVAALCGGASLARAHAPLPRALAVTTDASGIAVSMPGFGWLLRTPSADDGAPSFVYACDALLGVSPLEEHLPMLYRSDGTLIVGTAHGIRFVTAEGCPTPATPLSDQAISALAARPADGAADRLYTIGARVDLAPSVQRSDDGGEHWTAGATLAALPVTALVLGAGDPDTLYVSQTAARMSGTSGMGASIAVSNDGGASFETFAQERALTLIAVQDAPLRLWATARVSGSGVGVDILRARQVEGPWQVVLTVNFFGGFAVDPDDADVIWIGDEARGVYRSGDGGDSWGETAPEINSSCLAYGGGALWTCTPGLPQRTALQRSSDALAAFEPIMAFTDVQRLVDCAPELGVPSVCAPAWVEWQRDVLMITPATPPGATPDAGNPVLAPERDAGAVPQPSVSEGCAVLAPLRATSDRARGWCGCALFALFAVVLRRRRRELP